MQFPVHAVFFDVDGVLIDSLPQHLQICRDKAIEFGLQIEIPSHDAMRLLISRGTKVSPMRNFFLAVGFPETHLDKAVADYEREFMHRYRPQIFECVEQMLAKLRIAGLKLGLVTSNTRANVAPALGPAMKQFHDNCLFFFDRYSAPRPKAWCLAEGARVLNSVPDTCVYVGDQPNDATAAKEAGFQFLGVSYGWGIAKSDPRFETVDSVAEIPNKLVDQRAMVS